MNFAPVGAEKPFHLLQKGFLIPLERASIEPLPPLPRQDVGVLSRR